ncbi:MAG: hypothetical protein VB064_04800 [Oscillospiraceae bacterium]|nr:hypothetical protein [Oscillospiraceae bacterium]
MTDGVIKGTGNSRYLKSVPNFLSLYPTYADFVSALIAGTLPIDLNGLNADGWTTLATALSKSNLLTDDTSANIATFTGQSAPSTINEAFSAFTELELQSPLFELIREIPDTTVLNNISIDLSDIDWDKYTTIRLRGKIDSTTGYTNSALFRINNLSGAYYHYTLIREDTGSIIGSTSATSIIGTGVSVGVSEQLSAYFDIEITKQQYYSPSANWSFKINKITTDNLVAFTGLGHHISDIPNLTSFNIVIETAGFNTTLSEAAIWGIRK